MQRILGKTEEIINGQKPAAKCIVIETQGSTPWKTGAKMIVFADDSTEGSMGGDRIEMEVAELINVRN